MFPGYHLLVWVSDCELSTVNCTIRITYPRDPLVDADQRCLNGLRGFLVRFLDPDLRDAVV